MSPPQSRSRSNDWEKGFATRRYTAAEWEEQRPVFTKLYLHEGLRLPKVREIMAQEYGFYANKRQYDRRIKQWDLYKNINKKDAEAMWRIRDKRAKVGKLTEFKLKNGLSVPEEKLIRHVGDWESSVPQVYSHMATPEHVEYYTPKCSDPQIPMGHWVPGNTPRTGDSEAPSEYWTPSPGAYDSRAPSEYWTPSPGVYDSRAPSEYWSPRAYISGEPSEHGAPGNDDTTCSMAANFYLPHQGPAHSEAIPNGTIYDPPSLSPDLLSSPREDMAGSRPQHSPTPKPDFPASPNGDVQMEDLESFTPVSQSPGQNTPSLEAWSPQSHSQSSDVSVVPPLSVSETGLLLPEIDEIQDSIGRLSMEGLGNALWDAVSRGRVSDVRLLLDRGADISKAIGGRTPLHSAASAGHEAVVRLLLDRGADISFESIWGKSPLHEAAFVGHEAVVRLFLDRGADISFKAIWGHTPLHFAASAGHEPVVRLLLDRGADISKGNCERTPLHEAAFAGHEAVVRLLLDRGADISFKANWERTSLHEAARAGHEAVVRLLLDRGADISSKEGWGRTPLHEAVSAGSKAVVRLLLDRGADISSKDNRGWTPLHETASRGHQAVSSLLWKILQENTPPHHSQPQNDTDDKLSIGFWICCGGPNRHRCPGIGTYILDLTTNCEDLECQHQRCRTCMSF